MTFQEWYKNNSNMGNGGYEHVDKDNLGWKKNHWDYIRKEVFKSTDAVQQVMEIMQKIT